MPETISVQALAVADAAPEGVTVHAFVAGSAPHGRFRWRVATSIDNQVECGGARGGDESFLALLKIESEHAHRTVTHSVRAIVAGPPVGPHNVRHGVFDGLFPSFDMAARAVEAFVTANL